MELLKLPPISVTGSTDAQVPEDANAVEYESKFANPLVAAQRGFVDGVITPSETRRLICEDLAVLEGKRSERAWRKHGNMPL